MLVLSRKRYESINVGNNIEITVLSVEGGRVKLGIKAPDDVSIRRVEVERPVTDRVPQTLDQ